MVPVTGDNEAADVRVAVCGCFSLTCCADVVFGVGCDWLSESWILGTVWASWDNFDVLKNYHLTVYSSFCGV